MDINFANILFPRHCFTAKLFLFFCFFDQTWLVVITVKYIHPTFTIFFCFSNLFLLKRTRAQISLLFRKSKKTIYSPLSHAVLFVWLVVFVFTAKTKTRAINFHFDDMMVAVVRAGLHNTRDRRRAEGRLIFKCKTLQPRGRNVDFNFI